MDISSMFAQEFGNKKSCDLNADTEENEKYEDEEKDDNAVMDEEFVDILQ